MESLTTVAALAHRVPGKWIGIAVAREHVPPPGAAREVGDGHRQRHRRPVHPRPRRRLARGRARGVRHPAAADPRAVSTATRAPLRVLTALFSDAARRAPGVTLDDPFYPLDGATNEPGPVRPGGPPIWLGGQKTARASRSRRATRRAGRCPATGPATSTTSPLKRDEIARALEARRPRSRGLHVRRAAVVRRRRRTRGARRSTRRGRSSPRAPTT